MREILFRGKRIDNGEWVYGNFYTKMVAMGDLAIIRSTYDEDNAVEWNSISQYTGLKDKKGVKIFEGDKVKVKGVKSIRIYEDLVVYDFCGFRLKDNKTYLNNDKSLLGVLEIIGNIYDK